MDDLKKEWLRTQLHWDDKEAIKSRKFPKSVARNWRKMYHIMQSLCKEKHALQGQGIILVDIGCGVGEFCSGLESIIDLYIGIDPSDRMLPDVSGYSDRLFIRGAGEHLPLQSGIADIVLIKSVLDQCYDPQQVIAESYRILKDDGWLLMSLSNRAAYYALLRNLYSRFRRHKSRHFFQESHQFYFDMTDISAILQEEQFEIVRQISMGYFVFPRRLEWLMSERVLLGCIEFADKIGAVILPKRGGAFIFIGQCSRTGKRGGKMLHEDVLACPDAGVVVK